MLMFCFISCCIIYDYVDLIFYIIFIYVYNCDRRFLILHFIILFFDLIFYNVDLDFHFWCSSWENEYMTRLFRYSLSFMKIIVIYFQDWFDAEFELFSFSWYWSVIYAINIFLIRSAFIWSLVASWFIIIIMMIVSLFQFSWLSLLLFCNILW